MKRLVNLSTSSTRYFILFDANTVKVLKAPFLMSASVQSETGKLVVDNLSLVRLHEVCSRVSRSNFPNE